MLVGNDLRVDKDVKLMCDYFGLEDDYADMSPLVLPPGYTKNFIDGNITVICAVLFSSPYRAPELAT